MEEKQDGYIVQNWGGVFASGSVVKCGINVVSIIDGVTVLHYVDCFIIRK